MDLAAQPNSTRVIMAVAALAPQEQLMMLGPQGQWLIPIIQVAYHNDLWWSIPAEMSGQLYDHYCMGRDARYTWDWGPQGRIGSWKPDGEEMHINRYMVDFVNMVQTNIDNNRKRSVRIVWMRAQDMQARFTGQIPTRG